MTRNLLLELKDRGRLQELVKILRRSFTSLTDLDIRFDDVTDRYISVVYREQGQPKDLDIFSAGSGFQQFLYLFGFNLLRQPSVILLDEPDVHLHGSLQAVLLSELRNLVQNGKQVLFATHSRELITRVPLDSILSITPANSQRLQVAMDVYDTLDRLGSIDPTQLAMIQAYRRVVVVENRTDRDLVSSFCTTILGVAIWQEMERRLAFCFTQGNPWKQHDVTKLQQMFQQLIPLAGHPLKLFAIADRDYYPDDPEQLCGKLESENTLWHIWTRAEIENYLLCPDGMKRLISADAQIVIDQFRFQQEFDRLVEHSRNQVCDRLVQAFDELPRRRKESWDAATMSKKAREYLEAHWETNKVALADAKDVVLPGIKRWLQENQLGQFSDRELAQNLTKEDLPKEVHDLAIRLKEFAGL